MSASQQVPPSPHWANALLESFCAPALYEEIRGDLEELYAERCARMPGWLADLYYIGGVLFFMRSHVRRSRPSYAHARGLFMWKNYLKIAVRTLQKHKGYAFINITGLAVGLACCLLIVLYVQDELRYDQHHEHADRVYRVTALLHQSGIHWAPIGPPVGPALLQDIPEVEQVVRIYPHFTKILRYEDRVFEEQNGVYADSTLFEVLTIPLVQGNPATALTAPGTIVISEAMARKYFGDANPMGQLLEVDGQGSLQVSAVMEDLPSTTHLPFDYVVSMRTFMDNAEWARSNWTWSGIYTYAKLRPGVEAEAMVPKLYDFVGTFYEGVTPVPPNEAGTLILQPLTDIHLHSKLEKEYRPNGDMLYVYAFSVIAFFVLIIACINFVNLTTARGVQRMGEVGLRKALGAHRSALVRQFLGESVLMAALALVLALGLMVLALPLFNTLADKSMTLSTLIHPLWIGVLLALVLCTGVLSGSYPAFVLSRFRPVSALRGGAGGSQSARLRQGLVIFQFALSIFLIIGTGIVLKQLDYFRSQTLGFDKERVVKVSLSSSFHEVVGDGEESFKQELLRHPTIRQASFASDVPGERYSLESIAHDGAQQQENVMMRFVYGADDDYGETLGLSLTEGRFFSDEAPADTSAWVINEAAARRFGLTEPVGQILRWRGYRGPIVGVVEDFHYASLHQAIEPLVIPLRLTGGMLLVRLNGNDIPNALAHIETEVQRIAPDQLFRYAFVSDTFDQLYRAEERLSDVFKVFAALAILIACLGLFGLAAFIAEQRTKEIGVRKVLGASAWSIVAMLSKNFLTLVLIASGIGTPLAYIVMERWLDSFAYRIAVGPDIFLAAVGLAVIIAFFTVSYQTLRVAFTNPVKALRYE